MKTEHTDLLQRLKDFNLDAADSPFPFSRRLAKENQWSPAYARRVIEEYKRFAFLAVAADHPVSPSEDVDQAWHLHLTYSHNYWRVFCPEVLQKPFHHQPTKGGGDEHAKFQDWYARTLASYEIFFGEKPPTDIWPSLEAREKTRQHFVRVDREQHWIIRKPTWRMNWELAGVGGLILIALCGTGAMLANGTNPLDWRGPDFIAFYLLLFGFCLGLAIWLRRKLRTPLAGDDVPEFNFSPYELAYLNGGKILAVNAAIANLLRQRILFLDAKQKKLLPGNTKPGALDDLERVICATACRHGGEKIGEVRVAAKTVVGDISERLKAVGVVVSNAQAYKAFWLPLMIVLTAEIIGAIKLFIGVQRDKPIALLIFLLIFSFIASLIILARRPLRSRLGDAVLSRLQSQHQSLRHSGGNASTDPMLFAMGIGLFGMTALAGTPWDHLKKDLQPPGGSSSGCGSSCGSSCGGGCGGCGGGD